MQFIELYEFSQNGTFWRYTSSKGTFTYNSSTYSQVAIGRGDIASSDEISKTSLDVSIDFASDLAQNLLMGITDSTTVLTLYRSENGVVKVKFKGRLAGIEPSKNILKMTFVNVFSELRKNGIRRISSRTCPLALYGIECGATPIPTTANISAIDGTLLTLSYSGSFDTDYFNGGFLLSLASKRYQIAYAQDSTHFVMSTKTFDSSVIVGNAVYINPGCDKTTKTCRDVFSNIARFGGFPYMTLDNPFNSSDSL